MKIGFIVDTLSIEKGTGIARYSNKLYSGLQKLGQEVECIYPANNGSSNDIINHTIKLPYKIYKKKNKFEIFHANSPVTGLGLPLVKTPNIVTYNDLASILYPPEANFHVKLLAPYFYRIGKYCDKIISISTQTKQELIDYFKIPEDKISVINLGVDDQFYPVRKETGDVFTIGYIGSLSPRKRIDYLIKAFYHLKENQSQLPAKLVICGKKNAYYEHLQSMVDRLNLTVDVEFKGFVPDTALNDTYNSFDIAVVPSEWEGFGIPILEAQRCGIPVLTRDNAHIPSEVTQCSIKCKSEEDMADQIFTLLTDDKLYRVVSEKGIEYSKTFTWDKMVNQTINVYKEVL